MKILIASLLLMPVFAVAERAQTTSVYTDAFSKTNCRLAEEDEQGGFVKYICKGPAGFQYEAVEFDLRQTLNVIEPSGRKSELHLSRVSPYFSTAGPKIEWRLDGKSPIALIVRFTVDKNSETPKDEISRLLVVKLRGGTVCITDIVKASKDQNAIARGLADSSEHKPCMKFGK